MLPSKPSRETSPRTRHAIGQPSSPLSRRWRVAAVRIRMLMHPSSTPPGPAHRAMETLALFAWVDRRSARWKRSERSERGPPKLRRSTHHPESSKNRPCRLPPRGRGSLYNPTFVPLVGLNTPKTPVQDSGLDPCNLSARIALRVSARMFSGEAIGQATYTDRARYRGRTDRCERAIRSQHGQARAHPRQPDRSSEPRR